jgi:carboxyl-terminal processing protease
MGKAEAQCIATLGRVWGFLGYHHPSLATSAVDWDQVLVAAIGEIRTSPDAVRAVLERVIDLAGPSPPHGRAIRCSIRRSSRASR